MDDLNKVRVRIAPSPTGTLHVGTARTALFNELFARGNDGALVMRIEDTDKERSEGKYEDDILAGLKWLGIKWQEGPNAGGDVGPYRQSERSDIYKEAISDLLKREEAYYCFCEATEEAKAACVCSDEDREGKSERAESEKHVIKLLVGPQEIIFSDLIRGEVKMHTDVFGRDFIIAKSIKEPLYHLAVVVDDEKMEISHVIRGEDHISNTPKHILLQRALGYREPIWAHIPLLLDSQKRKLSKRRGETNVLSYRDKGYLPEALLNYLALLGWNPGDDQEILSHDELIKAFNLSKVQKGGAKFESDFEGGKTKLESFNKHYIGELSPDKLYEWGKYFFEMDEDRKNKFAKVSKETLTAALRTEQGRISSYYNLDSFIDWVRPDWEGDYAKEDLIWRKSDSASTSEYLVALIELLSSIDADDFLAEKLNDTLISWIDEKEWGKGDVLWPLRFALTGQAASPGPFEVASVLKKETVLERLGIAQEKLKGGAV